LVRTSALHEKKIDHIYLVKVVHESDKYGGNAYVRIGRRWLGRKRTK
jgi:hypothetical protein